MTDLCIAIVFHNKTESYVESLLSQIKRNVNIIGTYKVVLFDNREYQDNYNYDLLYDRSQRIIPSQFYYKLKDGKRHNWRQFEGRRYLLSQDLDSRYVWFVDSDDTINRFAYNFIQENSDIITFPFESDGHSIGLWWTYNKYWGVYKREDFSRDMLQDMNVMLWNKWIKTELLQNAVHLLPEDMEIIASEDTIYNYIAFDNCSTIKFYDGLCPYHYKSSISKSACRSYKSINKFKHIFTGWDKSYEILSTYNFNNKIILSTVQKLKERDCIFFLDRLFKCNVFIIKEAFNYMCSVFGQQYVEGIMPLYMLGVFSRKSISLLFKLNIIGISKNKIKKYEDTFINSIEKNLFNLPSSEDLLKIYMSSNQY